MDRNKLRNALRQSRRQLSKIEQHKHSRIITNKIIHSRLYKYSRHIALYLAGDGEVNISPLLHKIDTHNKKCYLPVILSRRKGLMMFAPYHRRSILKKNCFGINEPVYKRSQLKQASQLDLILAPLVAFDKQGNRMGMGGGFYDRALQRPQHKKSCLKPRFVGIAHAVQKVELLETHIWDIPLDAIVTNNEFRFF